MDFQFIETLLELPEFRVIGQVLRPRELELHLERRTSYLICPHCQGCCSRIKEGRDRCIRDLPMLDRPVTLRLHLRRFKCVDCHHRPWETSETFGARVKWTERLYNQVRQEFLHGCPCKELAKRYGLSARTVFRWTFEKSRGARPRKLGRVLGIDEYSRRKGHRYNTIVVDLEKGRPITTFKGRRVDDVMSEDSHSSNGSKVVHNTNLIELRSSFWICLRLFIRPSKKSLAIRFKSLIGSIS
jgi:transposase